ncbi:MAG: ThiF family adenylyltransferase [Pseudomonadota bacterium]
MDETNLHRQPIYGMHHIGSSKAEAAAGVLRALNPDVEVMPRAEWFDPALGNAQMADVDLALACADTFAVSLTLSDLCRDAAVPLITASALGVEGYALGCCGTAPSLRAIFPDLPAQAGTCATAGVMGPLVGMIGSLQAQMALSVLVGANPSPLGQVVRFSSRDWRAGSFRFDGAPEPASPLPFIAETQIRANDTVVDLRTESPRPFVERALHMDRNALPHLTQKDHERIVLACRTGLRAHNGGQALQRIWPGEIALLALPNH